MVTMSNIRDELKTVKNDKFDTIEVTISMSRETFDRFVNGRLCDIDIVGDDYYNDDETTAEMFLYLGEYKSVRLSGIMIDPTKNNDF